MARKHKKL